MQSTEQLSALSAEEGVGKRTMEDSESIARKEKDGSVGVGVLLDPLKTGSGTLSASLNTKTETLIELARLRQPTLPGDRPVTRKRAFSAHRSSFHPLPTIETMMTYPSLTRPTYNSITKGELPAQVYNTVIRTPKPIELRPRPPLTTGALDQMLMRAAETRADVKKMKKTKLRMEVTNSDLEVSCSEISRVDLGPQDTDSVYDDEASSRPPSPAASTSSTSRATTASSPPISPPLSPFPSASPSPVRTVADAMHDIPSSATSFQSSHSTLSSFYDSYSSARSSSRASSSSSYPSDENPASSTYPSPPASPQPGNVIGTEVQMSYSSPPALFHPSSTRSSTSVLASKPPSPPTIDQLSDSLFDDEGNSGDKSMDPSLNGGAVVFGAAGVAISPRMMKGQCCHCECKGLELYVIDEEGEEF
jgi:hypothetical protein